MVLVETPTMGDPSMPGGAEGHPVFRLREVGMNVIIGGNQAGNVRP
jgi:hypothetical protein